MYQATLALRDNPFGPDPASISVDAEGDLSKFEYLTNLDLSPLRIDHCPELRALFCESILGLAEHMRQFHSLMRERKYHFTDPLRRGHDSAIVIIRGAQGTGKTTLASWMLAEVMRLPGKQDWRRFELSRSKDPLRPWTEPDFYTVSEKLKVTIGDESLPGEHIAVLMEDVTRSTLSRAIGLFREFGNRPRLFVLTTHDIALLDEDPRCLGGSEPIGIFTLLPIRAEDAEVYVTHRIKQFREPNRPEIAAASPMFPFSPLAIRKYVERLDAVGSGSLIPLRVLNRQLRLRIEEHHERLEQNGLRDVAMAPVERLADYLLPDTY